MDLKLPHVGNNPLQKGKRHSDGRSQISDFDCTGVNQRHT